MAKKKVIDVEENLMINKYRKVKAAFHEFIGVAANFQMLSEEDRALLKLTLDNLSNEIISACNVIKRIEERRVK